MMGLSTPLRGLFNNASGSFVNCKDNITYEDCVDYWRSLKLSTYDDYATSLDNFKILYTCNTCCIEGENISYHNTREMFESGRVTNYSGKMSTLIAVSNQKLLFTNMINDILSRRVIDIGFIKEYHKILMTGLYDNVRYSKGERAGEFKISDYCVGVSDVGSFPEDVDRDLNELIKEVDEVNISDSDDILKAACYMHLVFESIHPFADGNGRLGRVLINYYLMLHGLPPVTIFDEDKETYYLGLEVFDRTGEISGFVLFIKEQLVKTWKNRIRV